MQSAIEQAKQDYKKMLLNATQYSGNKEKEKKIFSASMLGAQPLENYLKYKYGAQNKEELDATTLGSIYQLGVDMSADMWNKNEKQYKSALRMEYKLSNDWTISGEIDQYDEKNNIIIDNKLSNESTYKRIKSEEKHHSYALQLGVYKWLMLKNKLVNTEPETMLSIGNKTFSYYKKNAISQIEFVEIETHTMDDIEKMLIDKTNELQMYIDMDMIPNKPPVNKLMPYRQKNGKTILMKCTNYCSYNHVCPYYNKHSSTKAFINMDI